MTTAQRATADRMIAAKGQPVTLTRRMQGEYNPATGSASITETTQMGKGVIFDFADGLRNLAGTNIPAAARQCYLSALDMAGAVLTRPAVDDRLSDVSGVTYNVSAVSELSPAGTDILYTLTIEAAA